MSGKIIFHLPFSPLTDIPSGSVLRPLRMIQAFRDIGYEVDLVTGAGRERKRQIADIREQIRNGIRYDFLYSESSTLPTLLTEDNRFPSYPLMDFDFFRYCRTCKIRIGLFYRDIYWKFSSFKKSFPFIKRVFALPFYEYDLYQYNKLVDILYLPSVAMAEQIRYHGRVEALPPGADVLHGMDIDTAEDVRQPAAPLNIFYVGGLKDVYNSEKLFATVSRNSGLTLTFCCRENEWLEERKRYCHYVNPRIQVIHKSGKDLIPHYKTADLCSLFLEPIPYRTFSMPVKLFEYLGFRKPVLATKGTAAGDFVEKNDVGWNIDYSVGSLESLVRNILGNRRVLSKKKENIEKILPEHTWEARAKKVARDLTNDN